jgi:hypothetical protein
VVCWPWNLKFELNGHIAGIHGYENRSTGRAWDADRRAAFARRARIDRLAADGRASSGRTFDIEKPVGDGRTFGRQHLESAPAKHRVGASKGDQAADEVPQAAVLPRRIPGVSAAAVRILAPGQTHLVAVVDARRAGERHLNQRREA